MLLGRTHRLPPLFGTDSGKRAWNGWVMRVRPQLYEPAHEQVGLAPHLAGSLDDELELGPLLLVR